jgi:hypothetical protein
LAERAKRKRWWGQIRLGVYIVSFTLLAALGLAALANQLPADSIWLKAGGVFVILVPAVVAVMQLYDWIKPRLV